MRNAIRTQPSSIEQGLFFITINFVDKEAKSRYDVFAS